MGVLIEPHAKGQGSALMALGTAEAVPVAAFDPKIVPQLLLSFRLCKEELDLKPLNPPDVLDESG